MESDGLGEDGGNDRGLVIGLVLGRPSRHQATYFWGELVREEVWWAFFICVIFFIIGIIGLLAR